MKQKLKTGKTTSLKTILYIDQDCFKIVSENPDPSKIYSFAVVRQIKGLDEDQTANEIKKYIQRAPDQLILSLPRQSLTMKNFTIPSIIPHEISSMIEYQVLKMVPHPRNEIVFDYKIIKELPHQCSLVRAAVIHRKTIESYLSILNKAGLIPQSIEFGTEIAPKNNPQKTAVYAILEIDFHQSHIMYLEENHILYSRSISLGAKNLAIDSEPIDQLPEFLSELEASIALFPLEKNKKIDLIYLVGSDQVLKKVEESIRMRLAMKTEKFNTNFMLGNPDQNFSSSSFSFYHLINIIKADSSDHEINLLPSDIRSLLEKKYFLKEIKKLSFVLFIFIGLTIFVFLKEIALDNLYLSNLISKINNIEKKALEVERLKDKLFYVYGLMTQRSLCLDVLLSLFNSFPDGVFLKNFNFDGRKIVLRGYASNLTKIFELTSILENNNLFDKVETKYARQTSGSEELAEFHIECILINPKYLETQNAKKTQR